MYFQESFWRLLVIIESFSLDKLLKLQTEVGILLNDVHSFANSTFHKVLSVCFLCLVLVYIGLDSRAAYSEIA